MKTIYMLDRLDTSILINGERVELPKGMYVCPGFASLGVAKEYTQGGKFTISEVKI